MIKIACIVDIGTTRKKNDDRVLVNEKVISTGAYSETAGDSSLLIVCDGLGGYPGGDEAAECVVTMFSEIAGQQLYVDELKLHLQQADTKIKANQKANKQQPRMSTTIAGVVISKEDFIAFNIGDSRVYRFRKPYLMQLSTDHADRGLTRCIGCACSIPTIVEGKGKVFADDVFVICSDGVWGDLTTADFKKELNKERTLEEKCTALVELAKLKGSTDNLSIIIAEVT